MMTHAQAHHKALEILMEDMIVYVEFDQKGAMFQLLLEEFCDMDNDRALETLSWMWEEPLERAMIMITINAGTNPKY